MPFLVVFRPHQRPAWCESFGSEQELIDGWANGYYARSCNAAPDPDDEEPATFDKAWESLGHDLHALTRLDSGQEVADYLASTDYNVAHNRGVAAVRREAQRIGWLHDWDPPGDSLWHVMPKDAGQIVEVAYALDGDYEYVYRRELDKSTGKATYQRAVWIDGEFEPWNGELPLVDDWVDRE